MMRLVPNERPAAQRQGRIAAHGGRPVGANGTLRSSEKLWREYVEYNPDKSLELAQFLAKRGKVDEALQIADQRRKTDPPMIVLQVATAAAKQRIHPLTPNKFNSLEQWFQRAMRDDPESVPLQILWAEFLESQSKYDEVEKVYHDVLARSDVTAKDRAGVANNLAFALAVQGHQLDEAAEAFR